MFLFFCLENKFKSEKNNYIIFDALFLEAQQQKQKWMRIGVESKFATKKTVKIKSFCLLSDIDTWIRIEGVDFYSSYYFFFVVVEKNLNDIKNWFIA